MPGSAGMKLASLDSLFGVTDTPVADATCQGSEIEVPLADLHSFKNHPFKVFDDNAMQELAESIRQHGVLIPAIVRVSGDGGYEIIAGHRRRHACELAGIVCMPVIVRELDDDEATLCMVNSNLQRERILPSERAFAYKMMMDALKRQGKRNDLSSTQLEQKSKRETSVAKVAMRCGVDRNQIQRFIRLTELIQPLLDMVDAKKLPLNTGVELSYLSSDNQQIVHEVMAEHKRKPSIEQAKQLRELQNTDSLQPRTVAELLETVAPDRFTDNVKLPRDLLAQCFQSHTKETIETVIAEALEKLLQGAV